MSSERGGGGGRVSELTAAQARELARSFHEMSGSLGRYRFANWDRLTAEQRQRLERAEWSLLGASSELTAEAVRMTVGDLDAALARLTDTTGHLTRALSTVTLVGTALGLAAVAVRLAGAVMSGHLDAILAAVEDATVAAARS